MLGALKPHGVLNTLDRPTFLAMYYDLLGTLVTRQLMLGQSAVVDCLVDDSIAGRWQDLVDEHEARLIVVQCIWTDQVEHRRRVEGRRRGIPGWHEVGWDHVQRMRTDYPPLTVPHRTLDAMDPVEANLARVLRWVGSSDVAGG